MKFELIRNSQNMEWYGNIPCLPINYSFTEGERFVGEEADSWLLLEDFVPELDKICPNDLDYGDVDYFDAKLCQQMIGWLNKRKTRPMQERLRLLYHVLEEFAKEAIEIETGIVIGL